MKILDLHGKKHREVSQACHMFINKNWGKKMKIVTGDSTRMREIVEEVLVQYDMDYAFQNSWKPAHVIIRAHTQEE